DPRMEEARMGSSFVTIETGRGQVDYEALMKYLGRRSADPNVAILIANALMQNGRNKEAVDIFAKLQYDRNYGKAARIALNDLLGLEGFSDAPSTQLNDGAKPSQLQVGFRAADNAM